jgi:hypothetical protein
MHEWSEISRRVLTGEISKRAACREYDLGWHTLKKMLEHEAPPGYQKVATAPRTGHANNGKVGDA